MTTKQLAIKVTSTANLSGLKSTQSALQKVQGATAGVGGKMGRALSGVGSTIGSLANTTTSLAGRFSGVMGPSIGTASAAMTGFLGVLGPVGVGLGVASGAVLALGGALAGLAIPLAAAGATAEKTRVQFEVMLGSMSKANSLIGQLNEFANVTPFDNAQLITTAKTLMGFGIDEQQVMANTKMLGDIAAVSGKDLNELAMIYGKAFAKGKVEAETLNQISEAGIPILKQLATNYGVTTGEIQKMCSEGKVGAGDIQAAFVAMTSEGGKYFGGMNKLSETASGKWSTLTGKIEYAKQLFGEQLMPVVKKVLDFAISKIDWLVAKIKSGEAITAVIDALKTTYAIIQGVCTLGVAVGKTLYAAFMTVVRPLRVIFDTLIGGLTYAVGLIIDGFWTAINGVLSMWNKFMGLIGKDNYKADIITHGDTAAQFKNIGSAMIAEGTEESRKLESGEDWKGVGDAWSAVRFTPDSNDGVIKALDSLKTDAIAALKEQEADKDAVKSDDAVKIAAKTEDAKKKLPSGDGAKKKSDSLLAIGGYGLGKIVPPADALRNQMLRQILDYLPEMRQSREVLS